MRLFLAINLPPALRSRIHRGCEPLRLAAPQVSWIRSELLHFTVKFLGDVADHRLAELRRGLAAAASEHRPFRLLLADAGAFPNFRRPRVVWIGVRDQRPVNALAEDVEQACDLLGFARDARSFSAHLTLGRVKRELPPGVAGTLAQAAGATHNEYDVDVHSLDLMRSDLLPNGPRYTTLASLPLAAPA